MTRRALITGITGQDGSYLAELLLAKGYEVHGLARRTSHSTMPRIDHLYHELHARDEHVMVHYGDITDGLGVLRLVLDIEPDEIYNLAAQSHVRISFDSPAATVQSVAVGALHVLEAARQLQRRKEVRVYQASSSEMFGDAVETPQRESTAFRPQSPYACGKVYAHFQAVNYRRAYDLFACTGILFNHESPRRDESFVTRKITRAATRIKLGLQDKLSGQSGCGTRLGLCPRLRRGDVADYSARTARRFRHRHRPHAFDSPVSGADVWIPGFELAAARGNRPAIPAAGGSAIPAGRRHQSPAAVGLATGNQFRTIDSPDGRRRSATGAARKTAAQLTARKQLLHSAAQASRLESPVRATDTGSLATADRSRMYGQQSPLACARRM
jgi:dTDP-4-dehydrorhamnose reductase